MHNNHEILDAAYAELNSTEIVERVSGAIFQRKCEYVEVWDVRTQMTVRDVAEDLTLRLAFPAAFPYQMPDVYYFDTKYDYFPHIGLNDRKLCLYEDGASFPIDSPAEIIKNNIRKAKELIVAGAKGDNIEEFKKEIISYWHENYPKESEVDDTIIFWGDIPSQSCNLEVWEYYKPCLSERDSKDLPFRLIVPDNYVNQELENCLGCRYDIKKSKCCFISSVSIPETPPFCLTMSKFETWVRDDDDRKTLIRRVNDNDGFLCVFPLKDSGKMAGISFDRIKINSKGFRKGYKTVYKALTEFEFKNKFLRRILCYQYSRDRVVARTNGVLMEPRKILIAGLGSIGSNLCYFFSGHNNVSFSLVDGQSLTVDNIGRHFLGFQYIGNNKALAMRDFLKNVKPDIEVKATCSSLEEYITSDNNELESQSAIFMCTGDQMSEEFMLEKVNNGSLSVPVFILWLEPYAIAGHLVYINPLDNKGARIMFDNDGWYRFNLISSDDYIGHPDNFVKRDAGCNGKYALYSGNDVILFLSAVYPIIERLLETPTESKAFRWTGNTKIAKEKAISLVNDEALNSGSIQEFVL